MHDIRSGSCPLCNHHEVVEALPAEYGKDNLELPMTVTAEPRWVLGGRNPQHGRGEMRVYFCRSCGLAQWFVTDPEGVPIGADYKTKLIVGKKGAPFR